MTSSQPWSARTREPAPTWGRDFRRVVLLSFFMAIFTTILIGAASLGLMHNKRYEEIAADALWAGLCAGLPTLMFPFMVFELKRVDKGFRRTGLISLLLVGIPSAAVVEVLVMMSWPLILGDRATPGTVAAELSSDPMSIILVFLFVLAATAWFTAIVIVMATARTVTIGMVMALPYLGAVFYFMFSSVKIFENAPSGKSIIIWAALALAGFAVLTVVAAMRNTIDPPGQEKTDEEIAAMARRYEEERRRRG